MGCCKLGCYYKISINFLPRGVSEVFLKHQRAATVIYCILTNAKLIINGHQQITNVICKIISDKIAFFSFFKFENLNLFLALVEITLFGCIRFRLLIDKLS